MRLWATGGGVLTSALVGAAGSGFFSASLFFDSVFEALGADAGASLGSTSTLDWLSGFGVGSGFSGVVAGLAFAEAGIVSLALEISSAVATGLSSGLGGSSTIAISVD